MNGLYAEMVDHIMLIAVQKLYSNFPYYKQVCFDVRLDIPAYTTYTHMNQHQMVGSSKKVSALPAQFLHLKLYHTYWEISIGAYFFLSSNVCNGRMQAEHKCVLR